MRRERTAVLYTERLCLRAMTEADETDALEILLSEDVAKTYMLPAFSSREAAVKLFERIKELSASPQRFVYGVYVNERLIGFFNEVDVQKDAIELGYVIHPAHWNKGYATEALRALIRELFDMGYARVNAGAFEGNRASMRVMEKSGMLLTGETEIVPYRGKEYRCICYTITNAMHTETECS